MGKLFLCFMPYRTVQYDTRHRQHLYLPTYHYVINGQDVNSIYLPFYFCNFVFIAIMFSDMALADHM